MQTIVRQLENVYGYREACALARQILSHLTGLDNSMLIIRKDRPLQPGQWKKALEITGRLQKEEPLQYILGHTWFCSLKIQVRPGVLIPRPETEEMVYRILRREQGARRILDQCTGSGCIALALAKNIPKAEVTGADVSLTALHTARLNAKNHGLPVRFVQDDLLHPDAANEQPFDLITCNPPYVREKEKKQMKPHVTAWEPGIALYVPDNDPLLFYKAIRSFAAQVLHARGSVWMEINEAFGKETAQLFAQAGYTATIHQDIHGKDRFLEAQKKQ